MVIPNAFVINQSNNNFLLNITSFFKENLSSLSVDKFSSFIEITKNYFLTLRFKQFLSNFSNFNCNIHKIFNPSSFKLFYESTTSKNYFKS